MRHSLSRLLLPLTLLSLAACAPGLRVKVLEPAQVNLGAANRLSVVQSEGRRSAKEFVLQELAQQARNGGYFQLQDRTEEGISLKVAGRTGQMMAMSGEAPAQSRDEVALRVDVIEWDADRETREVTKNKKKEKETFYRGKVLLAVSALNASGRAVLAEKEYEASYEDEDEDDALEQAARRAIWGLLSDITPHYADKHIRIDEDDQGQKPILEVAKAGNMDRAIADMRGYLSQNQGNAAAAYNLAVMLDATGHYDEALDLYTKAISMASKDYYVQMRAECAKRQAAQAALSE
jgi:tetratricopeptide (TPR) repeat protein